MGGCGNSKKIDNSINIAEVLMENRPDSALEILKSISSSEIKGMNRKARYALLMTIALDKNYIDTANFNVLQPAIDFYLENGSPDEKLRTYYYQGVIHSNAGNEDLAMQSYLNGLEVDGAVSDSLTLARLLVAQGILFYKQYRIFDFIDNNLQAASIFKSYNKPSQEFRCYGRAIDGAIIQNNKAFADSLVNICKLLVKNNSSLEPQALRHLLEYVVNYGSSEEIQETINKVHEAGIAEIAKISLAHAYVKIDEPLIGLEWLNKVNIYPDNIMDSLTYWSLKSEIMESMGKFEQALDCYRNNSRLLEQFHASIFSYGLNLN